MISTIETAKRAFGAFIQGWANGDFQTFLEMLTDEFTFSYPYGKYRGKFTGLEGKAQIVAKCLEHSASGDRLIFNPPYNITSNDRTVMFECEGTIAGEKYQGRIAIALDVCNDKICGFREYFGDVDW